MLTKVNISIIEKMSDRSWIIRILLYYDNIFSLMTVRFELLTLEGFHMGNHVYIIDNL